MTELGVDLADLSPDQAALLDALLAEAVDERATDTAPRPPRAVPIRTGAGCPPLFVVHGSGGQVMFLHALARPMSDAQPVYGIEAGRASDEADPLAAYLEVLRSAQPSGPYCLGGYSAGCLLAFAMAARLMADGDPVDGLVLIDPAPLAWRGAAPGSPATPHDRLRRRFETAALAGVTPLSSQFGQIEQSNRTLAEVAARLDPRPLDLPIRVLHGLRGPYVSTPQVLEGWASLALRGIEQTALDADHFDIVREPHAAALGRLIQAWLDALPARER